MYRRLSTRSLAATTAAALISCIVVTGCQHSSAAATSASSAGITTASTPPATTAASTAAAAPTATSTCEVWPGVGDLDASAFPLREAAGDIGINGYEDSSDSLSVNVAVTGLAKLLSQLPDSYADEIQNDVITPAESGNAPELDTAAANAQSIATTISQLCYTP
jgi:hypothetical protein